MEVRDAPQLDVGWIQLVCCLMRGANRHSLAHRHKHELDASPCFAIVVVEE